METKKIFRISLLLTIFTLSACGPQPADVEQGCTSSPCTEASINAPVAGPVVAEDDAITDDDVSESASASRELTSLSAVTFPAYNSNWGLRRGVYDVAKGYYQKNTKIIGNTRYMVMVDFSMRSSTKRLYLLDLKTGSVERHAVAHGKNSDPTNTGYAKKFSNTNGSLMSSLGLYLTLATYTGENGYSLRLKGLQSTNSNAEKRAIVMHPASYVSDATPRAGRSWGCPALDPKIAKAVINKVKGGALLLITN